MKNLKIIIPGGAGFVGRNLVRILTGSIPPENITVIDTDADHLMLVKQYGINIVQVDLSKRDTWYDLFSGQDVIIHLAAQISSQNDDDFYRNNIRTTENIIEAAKSASVPKIIFFSSAAVLSIRKDLYTETKLQAEQLVKQSGLKYCIIRPSIMYGPTDDKNIGYLINFAKKMPIFPIPGHGRWPRQPIYVDDICYLVLQFLEEFPENKVYSINGRDTLFFCDMVRMVFQELGGVKIMVPLPIPIFKFLMMIYQKISRKTQFTPDQVDSLASCDVFSEYPWWDEFHIPITPFQQGIRKMIRPGE
jgi:nucleoside-diphosphate-sugar epimerase